MLKRITAAYLVSTALALTPALAQSTSSQGATTATPPQNTVATQSDGNRNFITQQTDGTWRASKLIGLGVYNEQNERVGDINEVLLDRSGKAAGVVIGVGGFLGIGERNVAVPYDDLKWSMTGATAATADRGSASDPAANPGGSPTAPGLGSPASPLNPAPAVPRDTTRVSGNQTAAYPDHAILPNASKEQLQKAPQFQYGITPR